MVLILQIAFGVVLGFAIIESVRKWREKQRGLADAYATGMQIGDAMTEEITSHLDWSLRDLHARFLDVLGQRLTIYEARIAEGEVVASDVRREETLHFVEECDGLDAVIREELEKIAERWIDGPIGALERKAHEGREDGTQIAVTPSTIVSAFDDRIDAGIQQIKVAGINMIHTRVTLT